MNTKFTPIEIREDALTVYKALSITHSLQQNISTTFDNLVEFSECPDGYSFQLWSRINSMFVEDLLANQELA